MRDSLLLAGAAAAIAALALAQARRADAIPAFARKYQLSCSACHAPFPRLNRYGEEFVARGYRTDEAARETRRDTVDTGDPLLTLPRELPLAVRMDLFSSWQETPGSPSRTDFQWPWSVKVISGGTITDRVSYYVYGIFEEGESIALEDSYLQLNSVFKLPVDVLVGQFQVSDPLFKRELRLEQNGYAIFETRIGAMPTDLTYDRGLMATWHAPAGLDLVAEVVNGNGIGAAQDGHFDTGAFKNAALRLARTFGPLRVGMFGYWGKETSDGGLSSRVSYLGPDLVANLGANWQLNLEYLQRADEDPFFAGRTGPDLKTRGGFAELHFFPAGEDGRWALSALYNKVDSDVAAANLENASLTVNYLLARNLRLLGEVGRDFDADASRLTFGIVTAF